MTTPHGREPNRRLQRWFDRSGWSKTQLAHLVHERATRRGHPNVAPDASRVRHWLAGEQPRPPVPEILAELFTERVSVRVTEADLGVSGYDTPTRRDSLDLAWLPTLTVDRLRQCVREDLLLDRADLQADAAVSAGQALLRAVQPWATAQPEPLPNISTHGRVGMAEVRQIEQVTGVFRSWDNTHGGGLSREAVVGQLKWAVSLLDGPFTETTGRALFRAVADLAGVVAWMSFDVGLHGPGQRYFILALHAAKEAGDRNLGAHILNCMARQANHLGHPADSLELIQLAQYGARNTATATTRAMLHSMEARAYAVMGRHGEFDRAVGQASDAFAHSEPDNDPVWVRFFDNSEFHATIGICYQIAARVDRRHADRSAAMIETAIGQRGAGRERSRAFDHIGLARTQVLQGELDGAAASTQIALSLADRLDSRRVRDRLSELRDELTPHRSSGDVRNVWPHVAAVVDG